MKIVSWNVNGIRAVEKKGFVESITTLAPDIFCLQETKAQPDQLTNEIKNISGYTAYFHSAVKKGYSGTATYTKIAPSCVIEGIGVEEIDNEGRVLTLEFDEYFVVNTYTPNAQPGLVRIDFRLRYQEALLAFLKELEQKKPVILCGDLNVAHNEIDLKNPKSNKGNPGFSDEEREAFNTLLDNGFIDTFRELHPEEIKYSWWSYRFSARDKNIGWRIDYFVVSKKFFENIAQAEIHNEILGSDHCPVSITVK